MELSNQWKIRRLLHSIWRRRILLVVPLLAMFPLSIVAAIYIPGGFVARTLFLLQETDAANNPLARDRSRSPERGQEALAGLRALLESDTLLGQVLNDLGQSSSDPKLNAGKIRDLRRLVSIDFIGSDFLELRLAGSQAKGLGHALSALTTRFLEAVTLPEGESAGDYLIATRKRELDEAQRNYERLNLKFKDALPFGRTDAQTKLDQMNAERRQKSEGERPSANTATGPANGTAPPTPQAASEAELAAANDLKRSIEEYDRLESDVQRASARLAAARVSYDSAKRKVAGPVQDRSSSLLSAPERMIIIDPPKDPELRVRSRIVFVVGGLMAGLLLGAGLAFGAEFLDRRIRYPEQAMLATGLPVIARLPALPGAVEPAR